jgi:ABC-type transport system involved in cytochrome bd biosynthesis fused ATPase/permease subunit
MIDSAHNHQSIFAESHAVLRKIAMTKEIKKNVSQQLIIQIASFKILFTLRVDSNVVNSLIKSRDIYNIKTQIRRDVLKSLISMQALMQKLDKED